MGRGRSGELLVDDCGDAGGSGEIGGPQLKVHARGGLDGRGGALDGRSIGRAADGRMIDGLGDAAAAGDETAGHNRSLGDGVHLSVSPAQGSHQEDAALKIAGVADGGRGDVDLRSRLRERGQCCRHHNGSGIGNLDRGGGDRNAHLQEHVGEALRGEDGLLLVAGAVEANHDAVADQLIVAYAFDRDQILEPRGGRQRGGESGGEAQSREKCRQSAHVKRAEGPVKTGRARWAGVWRRPRRLCRSGATPYRRPAWKLRYCSSKCRRCG